VFILFKFEVSGPARVYSSFGLFGGGLHEDVVLCVELFFAEQFEFGHRFHFADAGDGPFEVG
jgi:hypothetical protein